VLLRSVTSYGGGGRAYVLEAGPRQEPVPVDEVAGVVRVETKAVVPALMGLVGPQHPEGPVRQAGQRAPDGETANLAEHDLEVHGPPKNTWIGRIDMDYTCDREERVEMLILIVEDEPAIARFLERGLSAHGHRVLCAYDGEEGTRLAVEEPVDFVLLDISLPRLDGREVLRRIRLRRPDLSVLMLTARDDTRNKVGALDAGADDYLTKPFVFEELLARIRALTRRSGQPVSAQIQADDLRIDLLSRHAWRKDKRIDLSSREFALLEYFMRHNGQVLSRQQILSAIWDYDFEPASNVVDVYVRHLRNKVDPPDGPSLIQTIRGAGYRFDPAPSS
jgi:DNA-binding response OmpR family regulator